MIHLARPTLSGVFDLKAFRFVLNVLKRDLIYFVSNPQLIFYQTDTFIVSRLIHSNK